MWPKGSNFQKKLGGGICTKYKDEPLSLFCFVNSFSVLGHNIKHTCISYFLLEFLWGTYSLVNLIQDGGGDKSPSPPTSFSPVTSTNAGICSQNFLTFSFNPFYRVKNSQSQITELEPRPPFKKSLIKLRIR